MRIPYSWLVKVKNEGGTFVCLTFVRGPPAPDSSGQHSTVNAIRAIRVIFLIKIFNLWRIHLSYTNYAAKEINFKIAYYGPGLAGKSTNLKYIYDQTSQEAKGKMISLATQVDQTLFFDFLPTGLATVRGFTVRVHLYTVPGVVEYDSSRKDILKNADGVVFVADSAPESAAANEESFQNLIQNLSDVGSSLSRMPLVFQYNKRDVPGAIGVDGLRASLNTNNVPDFESVATTGKGVFETLKAVVKLAVAKK